MPPETENDAIARLCKRVRQAACWLLTDTSGGLLPVVGGTGSLLPVLAREKLDAVPPEHRIRKGRAQQTPAAAARGKQKSIAVAGSMPRRPGSRLFSE